MPAAVSAGPSQLGFFTELAMSCARTALLSGYVFVLAPPADGDSPVDRLDIDGSGTLYQDAPSGGVEPGERIRAFWIGDPGGDDVAIGRDQSDDNYWNGHVEPPRVYGGVLNASQIKGLLQ